MKKPKAYTPQERFYVVTHNGVRLGRTFEFSSLPEAIASANSLRTEAICNNIPHRHYHVVSVETVYMTSPTDAEK